ncbi:cell division protein FtsQ/DivIB [Sporosarcina siberiensis]|uniref:Cell division protein DivIB n=1 Tax=Sporosarcina siberiensis TaxID=1365606 RepID=A0ABW4SIJ0_9BACL
MDKVIDIEERIPSMREKRRRTTNKKFLFVIIIFIIALLIILYFQSPLSRINKVTISGANLYEEEFYINESGLIKDEPFWGFKKNAVEKALSEIEVVKKVVVTRKWFHDIEIKISEWGTIAYVEEKGQYSLLMENGELFTPETIVPEDEIPVLFGFSDVEIRKQLSKQLVKMEVEVYHMISEILFSGTDEDMESLIVYMDDGYEVRAIIPTFAESMEFYPDITAQLNDVEKGVIDMEVGTYFTPFSKMYGPEEEDEVIVEEDE